MSDVFFRDLEIPTPDYNLGIGSGMHGQQTGAMLKDIEEVLNRERPDVALLYGDTNSTLAGALAAAKLHIPVAHIEAGLRSFNRLMPEEINRVVTDHISSLLFCPTKTAIDNLAHEGVTKGVSLVGDVMYDALSRNLQLVKERSSILEKLKLVPREYFLTTVHRAENTDAEHLTAIFGALIELANSGKEVVLPLHPRTRKILDQYGLSLNCPGMLIIEPIPYIDMLALEHNATAILTDSGGVQKEAFWLSVPCITLRDETEWVETVQSGWNVLAGANKKKICEYAMSTDGRSSHISPSNEDGRAAARIATTLLAETG
jgi:UDP-N-acetylglucosamine 2-epimerase